VAVVDQLRTVPARTWAAGGAGLALVVVILVALGASGDDAGEIVSPDDATVATSPTSVVASTVTSGSVPSTTSSTSTRPPAATTTTLAGAIVTTGYSLVVDEDDPAVSARPIPDESSEPPPSTIAPPPWAASTVRTPAGHVRTDAGCAADLGVTGLDVFFSGRLGPLIGWDYQHVYPLGGDRFLWVFQDAFIDHGGTSGSLGASRFVHNAAMLQTGRCFQLLHRGSVAAPEPFEVGDGSGGVRSKWWWPMGGETHDGVLWVFWAEMIKDPYDPDPPDGLGWHPARTYLAGYDAVTLERLSFAPAPDAGAVPIYGYAVASDADHTYLFGNTFEQNLIREGGFWNGPHSATKVWLARVPRGRLDVSPEYRTADGWSRDRGAAVPIVDRYYVENPMQPRYLDGQWIATTAVDGYWGDALAVDVAPTAWGPWTTVSYGPLAPRNADPKMNTYHAHPLPWRDGFGSILITVSNNARDMRRDAWNHPHRYRPMVIFSPYTPTPPPTTTTTTTTTTTWPPRPRPPRRPPTTTTTLAPTTTSSTTTTTTLAPHHHVHDATTTSTTTTTTTTSVPTTAAPTSTTTSTTTSTSTTSPTTVAP
jgi:hypothetical protein